MPCWRQTSSTFTPPSACFNASMILASLKRRLRIKHPPRPGGRSLEDCQLTTGSVFGEGLTPLVTTYTYDVQDHLTGVTDAEGNNTSYTYSDRDLLTREESPVSGVTTIAYDAHGNATSTTDARNVVV